VKYLKQKLTKLKDNNGKDVQITDEVEEMVPNCELSEEKIMIESNTQTEYMSPVSLILDKKESVLERETNLVKVKEALDVLCKIIGYQNLEDAMGEQNEIEQPFE
jgi:hypothetical protein